MSAGAALAHRHRHVHLRLTALSSQLVLGVIGATAAGAAFLRLGKRSSIAATPQGFALIDVAISAILASIASTLVLLDANTWTSTASGWWARWRAAGPRR